MMNRHVAVFAILMAVLPLSAFPCPADGQHEPPKLFDPETAGDLVDPKILTPIEKRLNAIIVPEIDFRCANIYDIIEFYDHCVKEHGGDKEKHDRSRVRLVADKEGFGENVPLIHFGSLKMPLLYALKLTCAVGDLEYRVKENTVTVYKPKKNDEPRRDATSSTEGVPSVEK
jgi:hypothetical protein